uniref:Uncharacterized protein n=2 Tax=viral metagenome TaxID=1070528 RepID=A0A6M3LM49_9ZZZZ
MKFLQTDKRFNSLVNAYGCHFMSMLDMAERLSGLTLTLTQVQFLYDDAVESEFMDAECTLSKPHMVVNLAFDSLGIDQHCNQIGAIHNGMVTFWGKPTVPEKIRATILEGVTERSKHYRGGDECCQLVYDPNPNARVLKVTRVLLYTAS